jgi:Glycosyltransferase family 87
MVGTFPVGIDALVIVLLVVARMPWLADSLGWSVAPALAAAAFLYVAVDVLERRRGSDGARLKLALLVVIIALYVIVPSVQLIILRHASKPWTYVHDNVIQTEEAMKLLLRGQNPYAANYLDTPLYRWDPLNPALYHYLNLPFQLLVALPVYWLDLRIVYVAMFAAMLPLLFSLGRAPLNGLLLMAVFALNPLFTRGQVEGRNDIVVMWTLAMALWLAARERPRAAAVFVGLMCASKHTAWLFVPFYLQSLAAGGGSWRTALRKAWPAWATAAALLGPFIAWSPLAFYRSVIGYPMGTVEHGYPIRGDGAYGFATWVLAWHWVPNDQAPFPFILFQAGFGIPILLLCLRWQRRENTTRVMLAGYAISLFSFQFFTRYFNQNHFAFIIFILALATLVSERARVTMSAA